MYKLVKQPNGRYVPADVNLELTSGVPICAYIPGKGWTDGVIEHTGRDYVFMADGAIKVPCEGLEVRLPDSK